jgi:hypothetical protein
MREVSVTGSVFVFTVEKLLNFKSEIEKLSAL